MSMICLSAFILFLVFIPCCLFFFFNDTATTEIYTLSLHDALPICESGETAGARPVREGCCRSPGTRGPHTDRKSTRLNSSHGYISYAVFCLKKKKKKHKLICGQKQHDYDLNTPDRHAKRVREAPQP